MKKNKKRTLDGITPTFQLSDEFIAKMKLYLQGDPEGVKWMEERDKEWEKRALICKERLKQTCLTHKNEYGDELPDYYVNQLKKDYEETYGEKLDDE